MKKVKHYTHRIDVVLTEEEFHCLKSIRSKYKKPVSQLIRESIHFYDMFYNVLPHADNSCP